MRKNSALHSEDPELSQKSVLGIIESFTKTVVKRKCFQTNHSEHPELFQKNVLGIMWTTFFIEVAKNLPLCPL